MEFSKDTIAILEYVLPGFITAWVFYSLTSHPKPSQFERIVQAFIFNLFVQVLNAFGNIFDSWSKVVPSLVGTTVIALFLGFLLSALTNNDLFHKVCRFLKISKETSYPSEWYRNFSQSVTYIVLHMKNGRRLYGWPMEWPSEPEEGYFAIQDASWLSTNKKGVPEIIDLPTVEKILINVKDVEFVEFMK
jgi:hypothetical protein